MPKLETSGEHGAAPKNSAEAFRMGGAELKHHAGNGSTVAQAEIDRRAAKRAGKQHPSAPRSGKPTAEPPKAEPKPPTPEPKAEPPKAPAPEAPKAPEGVTTTRRVDRNGNVYFDVHRGDQPIGKVLKTSSGWQAERPNGDWAPFSSAAAGTDWLNRHHEMSKRTSEPPGMTPEQRRAHEGQAPDLTPEQRYAENKGDLNVGDEVQVPIGGGNRIGTVQGFDQHGRAQIHIAGHGTIHRSASDVSKDIHPATRAAEQRRRVGDWRNTSTETLQHGINSPRMSEEQKAAMREELARRGVTPETTPKPPPPVPPPPAQVRHTNGDWVRDKADGRYARVTDQYGDHVGVKYADGEKDVKAQSAFEKVTPEESKRLDEQHGVPPQRQPKPAEPEYQAPRTFSEVQRENRELAPAGFHIRSNPLGRYDPHGADPQRYLHTQYSTDKYGGGKKVGTVTELHNGKYRANGNRNKDLGTFDTRKEAHQAIADAHAATQQKAADRRAQAASRNAIGVFQPYTPESDGTFTGDAKAAKIKQAFKFGDHKVTIEAAMTKPETERFLNGVHAALQATGRVDGPGTTFHVPSGDKVFRASRKGTVQAYVIRGGGPTVYVNPARAKGEGKETHDYSASMGHYMPAAKGADPLQYTLAHELGHVYDNEHDHFGGKTGRLGNFYQDTPNVEELQRLYNQNRSSMSKYGQSSPAEAYAEAYAQWNLGGPGSSAAADAYARQFGWPAPEHVESHAHNVTETENPPLDYRTASTSELLSRVGNPNTTQNSKDAIRRELLRRGAI